MDEEKDRKKRLRNFRDKDRIIDNVESIREGFRLRGGKLIEIVIDWKDYFIERVNYWRVNENYLKVGYIDL